MHAEAKLQQRLREADRARVERARAYRKLEVERAAPSQAPALSQAE
jgi:hypothetical protein